MCSTPSCQPVAEAWLPGLGVDQDANFDGHSEIPSNLVLKKISPRIWLPALTVMWGIVTMCLGFVRNYAGFMAVRAVLGITEGGLLPGIVRCKDAAKISY